MCLSIHYTITIDCNKKVASDSRGRRVTYPEEIVEREDIKVATLLNIEDTKQVA